MTMTLISKTMKTKRIVLDIFNSLEEDIKFTAKRVEDFKSGKIPTLDMCMWVEKTEEGDTTRTKIMYEFWEKPMIGNKVLKRINSYHLQCQKSSNDK